MKLFGDIYRGKQVLITGHTGFKGSWLSLWLDQLGADVTGISLDPVTNPNHWDLLHVNSTDLRVDVRDYDRLSGAIEKCQPQILFHLAAQPLVRRSYRDPLETWSTNVLGTAHILEACRHAASVAAIVIITTDKVYENNEWQWGYRENDRLGGHDPYSASKACAELVVASYRKAFFAKERNCLLATVRAGNVIGGGDWSEDRLIPDLVRAINQNVPLMIRSPYATRPWQHVLESLGGYLMLGQRLLQGDASFAESWNFGPNPEDNRQVIDVLDSLKEHWPQLTYRVTEDPQPHEANLLYLDNSRARSVLGWQPAWTLSESLRRTAEWYREYAATGFPISQEQLADFVATAQTKNCVWIDE